MKLLLFHIFMKITVLLVNGFFWDFDLGADFWGWIILSWNFGSGSRSWGNLKFAVFLLFSNCSWKPLRPVPWWKFMQLKRFLFPWTGEFQTGRIAMQGETRGSAQPRGKDRDIWVWNGLTWNKTSQNEQAAKWVSSCPIDPVVMFVLEEGDCPEGLRARLFLPVVLGAQCLLLGEAGGASSAFEDSKIHQFLCCVKNIIKETL